MQGQCYYYLQMDKYLKSKWVLEILGDGGRLWVIIKKITNWKYYVVNVSECRGGI